MRDQEGSADPQQELPREDLQKRKQQARILEQAVDLFRLRELKARDFRDR